jgi:hypothetical protein
VTRIQKLSGEFQTIFLGERGMKSEELYVPARFTVKAKEVKLSP